MKRRAAEKGGAPRAAVDDILRRAVEAGHVPGVVAAVTDRHDTRYSAAYGVADTSGGKPMRAATCFVSPR